LPVATRADQPRGIEYRQIDARLAEAEFDGVLCLMSLMDVAELVVGAIIPGDKSRRRPICSSGSGQRER
jgi:hypothetical protein